MARILVCEDSDFQARSVKTILEGAGHQVVVAEDGQVGVSMMEAFTFDLVLSDVEMPRLTGFDVCRWVRRHPQHAGLPIVLMTTLGEMENLRRGQDVGATTYVIKPFKPDDLLRRLSKFLPAASPPEAAEPRTSSPTDSAPDPAFVKDLVTDCRSYLDIFENALIQLDGDANDRDATSRMYRAMHTIKGNCGYLSNSGLTRLAAQAETLSRGLRDGSVRYDPHSAELCRRVLVMLKDQFFRLLVQTSGSPAELEALLADLQKFA